MKNLKKNKIYLDERSTLLTEINNSTLENIGGGEITYCIPKGHMCPIESTIIGCCSRVCLPSPPHPVTGNIDKYGICQ